MEDLKVAFEPFVNDSVRRFIDDGINDYNFAVTGMPEYFPANFVLRSERGEVLGGLLAVIWGEWLRVGTLWVSEIARRQGHGSRLWRQRKPSHGNAGVSASASALSAFRRGLSTSATGTSSSRPRRTIRRDTPVISSRSG
jgi:hypothetical protein